MTQNEEWNAITIQDSLSATIKYDNTNKVIILLQCISTYSNDNAFNSMCSAPSSTGKTYLPIEITKYFDESDVKTVGYCSPTAFFHDTGTWDKENKQYIINLERKILLFLDQPHTQLLAHLRPLLSHDKKEIVVKITDKSQKHGLKTKNVLLIGYPTVIFCTAGSKIDEQEATRCLLLSPETTEEKIKAGIKEKVTHDSDVSTYNKNFAMNLNVIRLKNAIQALKTANINQVLIPVELQNEIENYFVAGKKVKPRDQRDIGRFINLIKAFTLINFKNRKQLPNNSIEANKTDFTNAKELWINIKDAQELSVSPYILGILHDIIEAEYKEKEFSGLTRKEILLAHFKKYGRNLSEYTLRSQILPTLENAGAIVQEPSPTDSRVMLIHPLRYCEQKGRGVEDKNTLPCNTPKNPPPHHSQYCFTHPDRIAIDYVDDPYVNGKKIPLCKECALEKPAGT